jgi:hypothetical protein
MGSGSGLMAYWLGVLGRGGEGRARCQGQNLKFKS